MRGATGRVESNNSAYFSSLVSAPHTKTHTGRASAATLLLRSRLLPGRRAPSSSSCSCCCCFCRPSEGTPRAMVIFIIIVSAPGGSAGRRALGAGRARRSQKFELFRAFYLSLALALSPPRLAARSLRVCGTISDTHTDRQPDSKTHVERILFSPRLALILLGPTGRPVIVAPIKHSRAVSPPPTAFVSAADCCPPERALEASNCYV